MVLRPQSLEWHHGGDDDSGELQVLLLHSTASRVRAAGEAGDDPERCLTVSGTVDGYSVTLVLRCSDTVERDQWLRATCRCIESLKSMVLESTEAADAAKAAVAQSSRLLQERIAEKSKLVRQLEQAKMQEEMNVAMDQLNESVGDDVPTLDEV